MFLNFFLKFSFYQLLKNYSAWISYVCLYDEPFEEELD